MSILEASIFLMFERDDMGTSVSRAMENTSL